MLAKNIRRLKRGYRRRSLFTLQTFLIIPL